MPEERDSKDDEVGRIELVLRERSALVGVCKDLLPLLNKLWYGTSDDEDFKAGPEIERLMLQVSQHLANIGGFCDGGTRRRIHEAQRLLALALLSPSYYIELKAVLPFIVGIQVDFTKTPFRVVGLSFKGLGAELQSILKK